MVLYALARAKARVMLSIVFIYGGWTTSRQLGHRTELAAAIGIPQPELAVRANGAVMVVAGIALALDFRPRWAAMALAACLASTTIAGHAFWKEEDPQRRAAQGSQFRKNLAIMGGLLAVAAARSRAPR